MRVLQTTKNLFVFVAEKDWIRAGFKDSTQFMDACCALREKMLLRIFLVVYGFVIGKPIVIQQNGRGEVALIQPLNEKSQYNFVKELL